jgi:xanthine dehydrogenase molybdopterin-binding subunit B
VGFFTNEEYTTNSDGLVIHDGTWTYKIPTVDTIPKQFNVEMFNSAPDQKRVLSSKGERLSLSLSLSLSLHNVSSSFQILANFLSFLKALHWLLPETETLTWCAVD